MRTLTTLFLFLSLFLIYPSLASATNLVLYPSFDLSSDVTNGWGNLSAGKVWSSDDVDASVSSGSLLIINDRAAGAGVYVVSNCLQVFEGLSYDFTAWYFMQIFQPGSGNAQLAMEWRESCNGSLIGEKDMESSTVEGLWTQISGQAVAPSGAGAAYLWLLNGKTTGDLGDDREIYFDEIFVPEPNGAATGLTVLVMLTLLRKFSRRTARGQPRQTSTQDN